MEIIDHLNRYVSNVDKFIIFYGDVLSYQLLDKGIKSKQFYNYLKSKNSK